MMRGCTRRGVAILCSSTTPHLTCLNHSSLPPPSHSSPLCLDQGTTGQTLLPPSHHKLHLNPLNSLPPPSNITAMGLRAINIMELPSIKISTNSINNNSSNSRHN